MAKFKKIAGFAQIPIMIGLLLMAVALPAMTKLVQNNQENRSKAAGDCEYTFFEWGNCYTSGFQTRQIKSILPAGCKQRDVTAETKRSCSPEVPKTEVQPVAPAPATATNCTGTSSSVALTDKRWVYTGTVCSELAVGGNCKNCGGDKDCYISENGCKLDHPAAPVPAADSCPSGSICMGAPICGAEGSKVTGTCSKKDYVCCKINETNQPETAITVATNCTGTSSSVALTDKRWVYTGTVCSELAVGGNCKNCGGDKDCYISENGCKLDHPVAAVCTPCANDSDNIKRKSGRFSCTSAKADKSDFDIWVGEYMGDGRKVINNNYQADANCDGYVSLVDFAIWLENKLK